MTAGAIYKLSDDPSLTFPDPALAQHPEGLVAWGGDLTTERLIQAYRQGLFPWYEEGGPILWWSPDPRMVFEIQSYTPARRLQRLIRQMPWSVTLDTAFEAVITACASPRAEQAGTWITPAMIEAYIALHQAGWAHSIEVWENSELVGGVYGVAAGRVFCAESKFHRKSNASKVALAALMALLKQWSFDLLDCQVPNPHLERLGAVTIARAQFLQRLKRGLQSEKTHPSHRLGHWQALSDALTQDIF